MKINLSTGWRFDYAPSIKDSFLWAKKFNFDGLELVINQENFFHGKSYIKNLSEKYQLPVTNIHCPIISMPFLWPLKRGVNITFNYASFLNSSLVVIHPPYMKGYLNKEGHNLINYLVEKKKNYPSIIITLENFESDNYGTSRNLEDLKKILEGYDLYLTLDTTHIGFSNYNLFSAYRLFKDRIRNVHLSNQNKGAEHLPPYQGNLPLERFLKKLKNDHYQGTITLELLYHPFVSGKRVKKEIEQSIKFIRKCLNK